MVGCQKEQFVRGLSDSLDVSLGQVSHAQRVHPIWFAHHAVQREGLLGLLNANVTTRTVGSRYFEKRNKSGVAFRLLEQCRDLFHQCLIRESVGVDPGFGLGYVRQEIAAICRQRAEDEGSLLPNMCCALPFETANAGTFAERQVEHGCCPPDLITYRRLCETGLLYEHLMRPGDDRAYVKDRVMIDVFFGERCYRSAVKDRFVGNFPTVADILDSLKAKGYEHAARLLQNYESTLVIAIICDRIRKDRPDTPVFTIHDSILTVPPSVDLVRGVILEEFSLIGVQPSLKVERY
jgi:hypothetical protein